MVMRPKGSLSAAMSKNTFGRLILAVGAFGLVEYDRNDERPPEYECLGVEQYWNCRPMIKRNVVDAIVLFSSRFRGYATLRRYTTSKENGNSSATGNSTHAMSTRATGRTFKSSIAVRRKPGSTRSPPLHIDLRLKLSVLLAHRRQALQQSAIDILIL